MTKTCHKLYARACTMVSECTRQILLFAGLFLIGQHSYSASISGSGTTFTVTLAAADDLTIQQDGDAYTFSLAGSGTWSGSVAGTTIAGNLLTITASARSAFNLFRIVDGGAGVKIKIGEAGYTSTFDDAFDIELDAGADLTWLNGNVYFTGGNGISVTTDGFIRVTDGELKTVNGNITLSANMQATPRTFNYYGVLVGGTVEATGSGVVVVKGKGGSSNPNYHGIILFAGGRIIGGTTGTTIIEGIGMVNSSTSSQIVGIDVGDGIINTNGSHVNVQGSVVGTPPASQGVLYGVSIGNPGLISAGGSGTVTVSGTGGAGGNDCIGVRIDVGSITSNGGAVTVTGNGGGSGSSTGNYGISIVSGGTISAGGSGAVSVTGTGGTASGNNQYGVSVTGVSSSITSSGGNVSVTGMGGGSGASATNYGIAVVSGGTITAGSSGTVTLSGTGGSSSGNDNHGVYVGGTVTSNSGAVNVTGTGGGSGTSIRNAGVVVYSATITAGSTGNVTVIGTGGNATGAGSTISGINSASYRNNTGIWIYSTGKITSGGGNVNVTGNGGGVTGTNSSVNGYNHGIYLESIGSDHPYIKAEGSGNTQVTGKGGSNSSGSSGPLNHGIMMYGTSSGRPYISAAGGMVTVQGTGGCDGGTGVDNFGIYIYLNGYITSAGSGQPVNVTGTGGAPSAGGSNNFGIRLRGTNASNRAMIISDNGGNITVNATGGSGTGIGLNMERGSWIAPTLTGTLTINTGSIAMSDEPDVNPIDPVRPNISSAGGQITINASEGSSSAVSFQSLTGVIDLSSSGANLTINANSVTIGSSSSIKIKNGSTFILKPKTAGTAVNLHANGALNDNTVTGPMNLASSFTDIPRITGGTLQIGDENTGLVTSSTPITMNAGTSLKIVTATSSAGLSPTNTGTASTADFIMPSGTTFTLSAPLNIKIIGTTVNNESTGYRQLTVNGGTLALSGTTLALSGTYTPVIGNTFTIVSASSITGTFDGLAENATVNFNGKKLRINYTSTAVTLTCFEAYTWNGSVSSIWTNANNWTPAGVPTSSDQVDIPAASARAPQLSANASLRNLSIASGSTLTVPTATTLTVSGILTVDGVSTGDGTISMAGTSAQTITGAGTVKNLTVNNSTGVTITAGAGNELKVTGTLTPTTGVLTTNGNLRLKSTATETARIGQHTNTGSISGTVAVERFLDGGSRVHQWRLFGFPYSTSVALSSISGMSIDVTTNKSVMIFNESGDDAATTGRNAGYQTFSNLSDVITPGQGFAAWVFGNSGGTASAGSLSAPLTIASSGNLNESGNAVSIPVSFTSGKGWNLVANPFASSIDWSVVVATASNITNVGATVYRWNPVTQVWASHNGSAGTGMNNIIESGAGFFVRTTATSPSLTIPQAAKVATNANSTNLFRAAPFRLDIPGESIRKVQTKNIGIRMWAAGMGNPAPDEIYLDLSREDATAGFDNRYDAHSMGRTAGAGLSITDSTGLQFAMQFDAPIRQAGKEKRYYPLTITTPVTGETVITLAREGNWDASNSISLIDLADHRTIIMTGDTLRYSFRMDQKKISGRFMVAVNHVPISPVNEVSIKALGNPVTTPNIDVIITHPNAQPHRWVLTSVNGAKIGEGNFQQRDGNVQYRIHVPAMQRSGIYQLSVEMDNGERRSIQIMRQ